MGIDTRKSHRFAHQVVQAFAFGSENNSAVHFVIEFVIALGTALIQADGPDVAVFQLFQRA